MKLTSILFEAYLKCSTKCYLRSTGQVGSGNTYADWVRQQNEAYQKEGIVPLLAAAGDGLVASTPGAENLKTATWRLAVDLPLETETMASRLHAVQRVPSPGRGSPAHFIPVRFVFFNRLTKDDRLLMVFDALMLSEVLGSKVEVGIINHGDDHAISKVKVAPLRGKVPKLVEQAQGLMSAGSPPDLILNRHCGECEFRDGCRQQALEKDDLSLLSGMTEKERRKSHRKGIFTVTQLSYTFRPRSRPKRLRDKKEKYHHSLKALAIREKKIHVVGSPELKIEGTPVYLDVEGLPDRDFFYLIGIRVGNGKSAVQHSLWADTRQDEGQIWRKFLGILRTVEKPVLIHYGSYESIFPKKLAARYIEAAPDSGAARAIDSACNLLSVIFAQVYFPAYSNGLKEIAAYLKFKWTDNKSSGLLTINWRTQWEISFSPSIKEALLRYNSEDCEALQVITDKLLELTRLPSQTNGPGSDEVINAQLQKDDRPYGFKVATFCLPEMDAINQAAYWDYQRERVFFRTAARPRRTTNRRPSRGSLRPNKIIECSPPTACRRCHSTNLYKHGRQRKTVFDLRFLAFGLKRWIIRYQGHRHRCNGCHAVIRISGPWTGTKFGHQLLAYAIQQIIELRIPQEIVDRSLRRVFGLNLGTNIVRELKSNAAKYYKETYEAILARICAGRLIHADETKIRLQKEDGFVWVLTNLEMVAYIYTATREGTLLRTLLKDFTGVLVSDFYALYDGFPCPQQKCLIHLLRDLNEALLDQPYNTELRRLAQAFTQLVQPMIETIDRYGLKRRFLGKHLSSVERFYEWLSQADVQSEATRGFKERFDKNRSKLFTFLNYDGVPWNNNAAEHAIKAFAKLRRMIDGHTTEKGIRDFAILLSVCRSCEYSGVDFLEFLRSGEKDLFAYCDRRSRPKKRPQPAAPAVLTAWPPCRSR